MDQNSISLIGLWGITRTVSNAHSHRIGQRFALEKPLQLHHPAMKGILHAIRGSKTK
jgi:hypothetical protein